MCIALSLGALMKKRDQKDYAGEPHPRVVTRIEKYANSNQIPRSSTRPDVREARKARERQNGGYYAQG
jgi:hypothetical protein